MLVMFRIAPVHWLDDESLRGLIHFLQPYRDCVDELALFTAHTHAPLRLPELESRLSRLGGVMARLREDLEMRVGINVLTTIGHHEENLDNSLATEWERLTDERGRKCQGGYCPNDPRHREYVAALYESAALADPDFIWVDDDVRLMGHAPIRASCFCDRCLEIHSQCLGEKLDISQLLKRVNGPDRDRVLAARRLWLAQNRDTISAVLRTVAGAVQGVKPGMSLGFMTGDRFYEGYAFERWAEELGCREAEVRWRPGGGFYWDDHLMGMVEKAHDIGRQVASLPDGVEIIQSEVENFPYQILKKSVRTTMLEAAVHMAAGATGIAFNVLGGFPEPLDEYRPFLDAVKENRGFLQLLQDNLSRLPTLGVFPAWNEELFVANGTLEDWFGHPGIHDTLRQQYVLSEIGVPMCYSHEESVATTLSGSTPLAFGEAGLRRILAGGVLLDAPALLTIQNLGLGELAGVQVRGSIERDAAELILPGKINGCSVETRRDCRQSFWGGSAYVLEPTAQGVCVLGELEDYGDEGLGITMTAFENELGGRVVVSGYRPWFLVHSRSKSNQLKHVLSWLSRGGMPAMVEDFAKVVVWARGRDGVPSSLVLLNASLDPLPRLRIGVRTSSTSAILHTMGGPETEIEISSTSSRPAFEVENVEPWSVHLVDLRGDAGPST